MLAELAAPILMTLSSWLGVESMPPDADPHWRVAQPWHEAGGHVTFRAESSHLHELCMGRPDHVVHFPPIIQAYQGLFVNGRRIAQYNDASFRSVTSFYGTLDVPCSLFETPGTVEWRIVSFMRYFARFSHWPEVRPTAGYHNFFAETLHGLVAAALAILGLFSLIVFWRKVAWQAVASLTVATFFLAFYFAGMTPKLFHIPGDMMLVHKTSDICLWIGMVGVFSFLATQRLFNPLVLKVFFTSVAASVSILLAASNGDVAQLGTTIPFLFAPAVLTSAFARSILAARHWRQNRRTPIEFLEVLIFIVTSTNDMLFVLGLVPTVPLLPLGMLGILFFAALSLEQQVKQICRERDYLRQNLENEVAAKTSSLERALQGLKCAQAELVQSAKLASLGTLSAGIAHEINNSLNYVNGSLVPLANILKKSEITDADRGKADRLMGVMREGLHLTSQIILNLKSYTRSGSGVQEAVAVREVVEGALVILRNKVKNGVEVRNEIPPELSALADKVSLSQVLMNLIDNAIDAMDGREETSKLLTFRGGDEGEEVWFSVADTGPGIPEQVQERIFDPFFTTKPEGKGTGLGLYIVKNEIEKQGGSIRMVSRANEGTEFTLRLGSGRRKVVA